MDDTGWVPDFVGQWRLVDVNFTCTGSGGVGAHERGANKGACARVWGALGLPSCDHTYVPRCRCGCGVAGSPSRAAAASGCCDGSSAGAPLWLAAVAPL